MIRKSLWLAALFVTLVGASTANAAVPRMINFQGRLADASGTPVTGSYSIVFSIWNATSGGAACFTETQAVAVNSGLFNANVGSASGGISSGCDFSVPYYLQVQVGSDSPMSPRFALTAAAYALRAQIADDSVKLNGKSQGNAAGQIPSNNGVLNVSLNANLLEGKTVADINALINKAVYMCSWQESVMTGYDSEGGAVFSNVTRTYFGAPIIGACASNTVCNTGSTCVPAACASGCTDMGLSAAYSCGTNKTCRTRYCFCAGSPVGYVRP